MDFQNQLGISELAGVSCRLIVLNANMSLFLFLICADILDCFGHADFVCVDVFFVDVAQDGLSSRKIGV